MVSTTNDFVTTNCNQCNCLGVSGFETNRSSCSNVKTVAISFDTIEFQLRIGLDEVVVRTNLP